MFPPDSTKTTTRMTHVSIGKRVIRVACRVRNNGVRFGKCCTYLRPSPEESYENHYRIP